MSAMPDDWGTPPPRRPRPPARRRGLNRPARKSMDKPVVDERVTQAAAGVDAAAVKRSAAETDHLDERPAPRAPFIMLVLALVAGGMVALVLLNTAINENAFRLDALGEKQTKLDLREQQLNRDLAELESSGSLAAAAKRLGLVFAGSPAFIELPSGRVVGVPTPAGSSRP